MEAELELTGTSGTYSQARLVVHGYAGCQASRGGALVYYQTVGVSAHARMDRVTALSRMRATRVFRDASDAHGTGFTAVGVVQWAPDYCSIPSLASSGLCAVARG